MDHSLRQYTVETLLTHPSITILSYVLSGSVGLGVLQLGIVTGNPRVFEGYPYLYLPKTQTCTQGKGFHGYRSWVLQVIQVRKPT
jgi:hypothetical protein